MLTSLDSLAADVKAGKYVERTWEAIKMLFPAKTDLLAKRKLDAWVKKEGLAYELEGHTMIAGKRKVVVPVVVFKVI